MKVFKLQDKITEEDTILKDIIETHLSFMRFCEENCILLLAEEKEDLKQISVNPEYINVTNKYLEVTYIEDNKTTVLIVPRHLADKKLLSFIDEFS